MSPSAHAPLGPSSSTRERARFTTYAAGALSTRSGKRPRPWHGPKRLTDLTSAWCATRLPARVPHILQRMG